MPTKKKPSPKTKKVIKLSPTENLAQTFLDILDNHYGMGSVSDKQIALLYSQEVDNIFYFVLGVPEKLTLTYNFTQSLFQPHSKTTLEHKLTVHLVQIGENPKKIPWNILQLKNMGAPLTQIYNVEDVDAHFAELIAKNP